jgi:hypothetical protein
MRVTGHLTRSLRTALGLAVLLAACSPLRGCAESDFTLAAESRLPRWFSLPQGVQRKDVNVALVYYTAPIKGPAVAEVTLRTNRGEAPNRVVANLRGEPEVLDSPSGSAGTRYPMYEVLTANGITEVIEHRHMEPVFYITDDPEVRRKLGVNP